MKQGIEITELLDINRKEGIINLQGNRMLVMKSSSLFELRKEMLETLGEDITRGILASFGYRCGFNDVNTFPNFHKFENDANWMLAGPLMDTLTGVVHATTETLEYDRKKGTFLMRGIWRNSYEAEHHLRLFGQSKEPVCWTLSGYASGFGTGFFGQQVICVETMCQGMGDPYCQFELRNIEAWNGRAMRNADDLKHCLMETGQKRVNLWRGMSNSVLERTNEILKEKISELSKVNKLLNQEKAAMQKSAAIHNQLTFLVLDGQGLSGITENLAHIIGRPVLVADRFFQVLSCFKPLPQGEDDNGEGIESIWKMVIADPTVRQDLLALGTGAQYFSLMPPGLVDDDVKKIMVVPIIAGNNHLGFVSALEEKPLSKLDCIALEHAATVIALEMLKQKASFETELRIRENFFEALLAGKYENEDAILWRANQLGLDLSKTYRLMSIDIVLEDVKDQYRQARMSDNFFETLRYAFESICPGFFLSGNRKNTIGLLPVQDEIDANSNNLSTILLKIENELKTHLPEYRWWIGIGSPCSRLMDFASSYKEARATIDIAKELHYINRCVAYEKLGILSLLNINVDHFLNFTNQIIGPLIKYDKKNNSQLVDTLLLYFENNCNIQKASRNGFLNSATMKYRLKRISEIANIDLSNSETNLLLHLAIKLVKGI